MIYDSIIDLIGNTPLIKLNRLKDEYKLCGNIYVKLESKNPGGSIKDRAAYNMLRGYMARGEIKPTTTLIEPTSGNTGIGLAMVAARLGLKFIVTMPESMSKERRMLISAYGAKLILTPKELGMKGAIEKANELKKELGDAIIIGQFDNLDNPKAHYLTTAKEIARDLDGKIDMIVAGIGTGGTITGISEYFHDNGFNTLIVGVEPALSPVLSGGKAGAHKLQGIGAGFKPKALSLTYVDSIMTCTNEDAYELARLLPRIEGILCGISGGAALSVAIKEALREENKDKNIVVILPDSGERYLSTDLYEVQ